MRDGIGPVVQLTSSGPAGEHMRHTPLPLVAAASLLALAACNPFRSPMKQDPVTEVTRDDANANSRWHGTLATPSNLAGAVQMRGTAAMAPMANITQTRVSIQLDNATPGGVHPWQVHRGQCGADDGLFGDAGSYKSLKVNDDGKASGRVDVPLAMPRDGRYYVSVGASSANPETIVACGNLASPTQ
jgi:hypothetical protein